MVAGKLTIVQILPELDEGGVEGETFDLAVYLAAHGHRSIVISGGGRLVAQLEQAGCVHITWPHIGEKSVRCLPYISKLRSLLIAEQVDVLHLRSRLPAWVGYLAWKLLPTSERPALITTFHGFHSINFYSAIMTKGERVVAVSEIIKKHILDNYRVDPQIISLIYGGFDSRAFSPDAVSVDRIRQLHNRWLTGHEGRPVIILPGRFTQLKGQDVLIESLALIKDREFVCLLVGDTEEHPAFTQKLRDQIQLYGLEDKVLLAGHCSDMPAALLLADIVVSASSTRPEAFGKVAIEAMAMGKPIIATAHGGSLETVMPGKTGWLVPPLDARAMAEAISEALSDPLTAEKMGRQGQAWVNTHFTAQIMCEKTVALYYEARQEKRR
ncbi:glycosyltransferase family 4 protein [Desulfopila sp. IMCC35006]|uniref:glycosyltransferase family 4 protein n=1 Tax=Desulfopila sp. IMCC35006 TaxID=2569542 RepID=UPI0010AC5875|nr:glycosyltransferase family 4 protein [Desulfopila sp. IMCC35006]TKB27624.1 glycosyltransferase family 4 protein [Desulfopila sp. IMCC35006]